MSQVRIVEPADQAAAAGGLGVIGRGAHRAGERALRRGWRPLAIGVVAAWLVVVVSYLVGAAALVPVLVLVGTASLIHGGRSLLDRLMIALALLLGAACLAIVLFSVWPWGLHPIAVGGSALTVLVVLAVLTGRRPRLPRPTFGDAVTLGGCLAITAVVAFPFLRTDFFGRLAIVIYGEDFGRHLTVFDAIRRTGGYLFLDWNQARGLTSEGMISYPQASHAISALLDNFLRSSATALGTGPDAMNHYVGFVVAGYGLFALTTMWATQWLAGPALTDARRLALVGVVAVFCLRSEIFTLVPLQYPAEVAGLVPVVLLVAFVSRPPNRHTTLIASLLVVATAFTYYLFLPAAVLALGVWLVRRRVWRHRAELVISAVAVGCAAVPPLLGFLLGDQTRALLVLTTRPPIADLLTVGLVVLAGLWHRRTVTMWRWRSFLWSVGAAALGAVGLYAVQNALGGSPTTGGYYYANKELHLVLVLAVLGVGAVLGRLPAPERGAGRTPGWRPAVRLVPGLLVTVAVAAGTGLLINTTEGAVPARTWIRGDHYRDVDIATAVAHELNRPLPPGAVTVVIAEDSHFAYETQLSLAALQRSAGVLAPGMYGYDVKDPGRYEAEVAAVHGPVLLVTDGSAVAAQQAAQIQARHGEQIIDVVRIDD